MKFQPGQSGNPAGRPKRQWVADRRRVVEAQKSFDALVEARDRLLRLDNPDARSLALICKEILDRTIGRAKVDREVDSSDRARLFVDFMRALLSYLSVHDQETLQHLSLHVENFSNEMKNGMALPGPDDHGNRR